MPNAPDYVIVLNNKECDEADTACDNQDRICKQRGLTLIDLGFSNDKDGPRNQKHALRVVCKWAGLVFPMDDAIPQRHPDLGLNIKVRISKCDNPSPPSKFGNLIIRPGDVGSFKYVLVTGHRPNYRIKGWLFGREAPDYGTLEGENTDHPFYLTSHEVLHKNFDEEFFSHCEKLPDQEPEFQFKSSYRGKIPNLQELVAAHGGYDKITPAAWAEHDRQGREYQEWIRRQNYFGVAK